MTFNPHQNSFILQKTKNNWLKYREQLTMRWSAPTNISTIKYTSVRLRKHHRREGMKVCKTMGNGYVLWNFALCFQKSYTQQLGHLNKSWIMTAPADMPTWIGEITLNVAYRWRSKGKNSRWKKKNEFVPEKRSLIGYPTLVVSLKNIHLRTKVTGLWILNLHIYV